MSRAQPHDTVFKQVFSRPELAADLLCRKLPPELIEALDLDRLEPVTGEFVDRALRSRRADLVFRAPLRDAEGRSAYVFLLVEHQSTPDRFMAWRVLTYVVEVWTRVIEQHRAEHGGWPPHLPAVVPVVVHQGARPWSVPRRLLDLIDLPEAVKHAVAPYLPSMELLIDDLAADADVERTTRLALTAAAVLTLRHVRVDDAPEAFLARWSALLDEARDDPHWQPVVDALVRYLYHTDERLEPAHVAHAAAAASRPEIQEVLMSLAEKFKQIGRAEGRQEGRVEGRQEGRAEGRQEGRAGALLKQLRLKFGEPGPDIVQRVSSAADEDVERWLERILFAETLDALFADR